MWQTFKLEASQWMYFYTSNLKSFFANLTPNQYIAVLIVVMVICMGMMRVKFSR